MEYNEIKKTNKVLLKGKIIDTLEIAYECFGENFLKTKLSCKPEHFPSAEEQVSFLVY